MTNLFQYAKNITSQYGEDGIIEEIFRRIGTANKICVEFGAWDGKYLSNTWNLWYNLGWQGVLIEGDKKKFNELKNRYGSNNNLKLINAYVGLSEDNLLDNLLAKIEVPSEFDLLSIDIDGDEYHVFNSLNNYHPRVVIIEHNPTIPPEISIVQSPGEYFGASALALQKLFLTKNYTLIACTQTNSFFVKKSEFIKLNIVQPKLENIFPKDNFTYVISSYSGKTFLSQNPVYSPTLKTIDLLINFKKKLRYYTSEYNEKISFSYGKKLIPVDIYINSFFFKRTYSLFYILLNRLFEYLKKIPIIGDIWIKFNRIIDDYSIILKWKFNDKPLPPPHIVKQKIIKKYCRRFSITTFVETGTYLGDMIDATIDDFKEIFSIEIDEKLYKKAKDKFCNSKHVHIYLGDSSKILMNLIQKIDNQCIFWLDGHYSEGITGKGSLDTPIIDEIDAISKHHLSNHILLIDDARCFSGSGDYPDMDIFLKRLKKSMPNHNIFVKNDIIRAIPK